MTTKLLVVLSGGQDSTTCLAMAEADARVSGIDEIHAVTFDYGQRHDREIQAARDVANLFGIGESRGFHEVVKVGPILAGRSPLTNAAEQLEQYKDHDSMAAIIGDRIEKTFVPMRNALFLTLAANRAAVMGASGIVTGVCQADNANYPDCRATFIQAQQLAINEALGYLGDDRHIRIWAPLMFMSKAASVRTMLELGYRRYATLAYSHTAYDGQYPPVGKDHASVLRAHGFEMAGYPDPLVLRAHMEGLMPLPKTANYARGALNNDLMDCIRQHAATLKAYAA